MVRVQGRHVKKAVTSSLPDQPRLDVDPHEIGLLDIFPPSKAQGPGHQRWMSTVILQSHMLLAGQSIGKELATLEGV